MKRLFYTLLAFALVSCQIVANDEPAVPEAPENQDEIITGEEPEDYEGYEDDDNYDLFGDMDEGLLVRKKSWTVETRGSDDRAFAKDLPWEVGDKVMMIKSDQVLLWGAPDPNVVICKVAKAKGLKCTLEPETPMAEGTYRAIYPLYNYVWFDFLHLSFLYEDWNELDCRHQDIVVSDPVTYQEGKQLKIVMKHVCALVDIDIYPPKTGNYSYLKLFAAAPVFPGKMDYYMDQEYDINEIASGWLNFITLRGDGRQMTEGTVFETSTGLLPIQYSKMPMTIHLIYQDGQHFVSEPIAMPSLSFGVTQKLVVREFSETDEPLQGLWGDFYQDPSPTPYPVN